MESDRGHRLAVKAARRKLLRVSPRSRGVGGGAVVIAWHGCARGKQTTADQHKESGDDEFFHRAMAEPRVIAPRENRKPEISSSRAREPSRRKLLLVVAIRSFSYLLSRELWCQSGRACFFEMCSSTRRAAMISFFIGAWVGRDRACEWRKRQAIKLKPRLGKSAPKPAVKLARHYPA